MDRGWHFPPAFHKETGTTQMVTGYDDVIDSIRILLSTMPGERLLSPEYGCDLHSFLFELPDEALLGEFQDRAFRAINDFEPRIKIADIEAQIEGQTTLTLHLSFNLVSAPEVLRHHRLRYDVELGKWRA